MATATAPGVRRETRSIKDRSGNTFTVHIEAWEEGPGLTDVLEGIRLDYVAMAKSEIAATFDDLKNVTVIVDGKTNGNIDYARLFGTGIIAFEYGTAGVEEMKKAFQAAMSHLSSIVGTFRRTGYYERSANTATMFTVLVNGKEQMPNWETATNRINIQIYSKARYAAPLEVIKQGNIMLAARNRAKAAAGDLANVSFTYRNPVTMGQIEQFSKRGGKAFTMLAVPVIEIGTAAGGTSNYVGNVSRNLNRKEAAQRLKRKPPAQNLIHRGIVGHDRWHNTPPRRPK
jgi:hypothetical protein